MCSAKLPVLDGVTPTVAVLPFYLAEIRTSTFEEKKGLPLLKCGFNPLVPHPQLLL